MTERATISQADVTRTIKGAANAFGVPPAEIEIERKPDGSLLARVRTTEKVPPTPGGWDEVLR